MLCCIIAGPETWRHVYPAAAEGKRQSPINIEANATQIIKPEVPLTLNYCLKGQFTLENTGHTWQVNCKGCCASNYYQNTF